jgi:small subunit ribosomal protein S17
VIMADKKNEKKSAPKAAPAAKAEVKKVVEAVAAAASKVAPTAPAAVAPAAGAEADIRRRRALVGFVRSDKMDKTVVVEVVSLRRDPVYGKYLKHRERYKAHDEQNQFHPGDKVEIREHRPLSRHKRWIVSKLIERAKVE